MPVRVVQWATGNIGTRALRQVIRHPDLELVGVLVYDPAKEGVDAGELCGEPPTGVTATTSRDTVLALGADCVLYMPRSLDLDEVLPLLASGTNIVTTRGEFHGGGQRLGEDRARVIEACERGRTSIFATGSSPGFITDALPFALLSLQREVDLLTIDEYANMSQRNSPNMIFELMGFGRPPESYSPRRADYLLGEFGPALAGIAEAAGKPADTWRTEGAVATARANVQVAAGEVAAGTIGAQRNTITGLHRGQPIVRFTSNWYLTTDVDPAWDLQPTGWRVRVAGDAPLDVALPFPFAVEDLGEATPAYTANRPVNAIPYVCAGRPGILSSRDLPPIVPSGDPVRHR
jgi:hypothetical protein